MSEGPIKQWRDGFLPARVTTNPKTAVHLMTGGGDRRPYCGYRKPSSTTNMHPMVTCSTCIANFNADADAAAGTDRENGSER